jgi:putative endonuclease
MHRTGIGSIFTSRYRCKYLLYYERHPTMKVAIRREKRLKRWRRDWKLRLIKKMNPEMKDLYEMLMAEEKTY